MERLVHLEQQRRDRLAKIDMLKEEIVELKEELDGIKKDMMEYILLEGHTQFVTIKYSSIIPAAKELSMKSDKKELKMKPAVRR